jgi:hypothetical protein
MDNYHETIGRIINLPWYRLNEKGLKSLMIVSAYNAEEFAESLRITEKLFPRHLGLKKMIEGELNTNNLKFRDYREL